MNKKVGINISIIVLIILALVAIDSFNSSGGLEKAYNNAISDIDIDIYTYETSDGEMLVINKKALGLFKEVGGDYDFDKGSTYYYDIIGDFADIGEDGQYIKLKGKSNYDNRWFINVFPIAEALNKELGLPEELNEKIRHTKGIDGLQTYEYDDLIVFWEYSKYEGLDIVYKKEN